MRPTRGSPSPSSSTSGRVASQSMSRETSLTSWSGSLREIFPPDFPNPRADQVSTAYPSAASFSAWARTSFLLPPNPWPMSTAGRLPEPSAWKYEVSTGTPSMRSVRSSRRTVGDPSSATAVQTPPPTSTASAAPTAAHRPGVRGSSRRRRTVGVSILRP